MGGREGEEDGLFKKEKVRSIYFYVIESGNYLSLC